MHRDDQPRSDRANEIGGRGTPDGGASADRHDQHVDLADRRSLLGPQRRLTEVAEVAEAQAAEGEAEDRVRPALRSGDIIVLGGDRDDLADRRLEPTGGRTKDDRRAADDRDVVVVAMLVRDEQEIGADASIGG